jgi:hypothetical protein
MMYSPRVNDVLAFHMAQEARRANDLTVQRSHVHDRRAAGCPEDTRWAILGHEEKTVAAGYGEGFPVPLLKRWIDKIGF